MKYMQNKKKKEIKETDLKKYINNPAEKSKLI